MSDAAVAAITAALVQMTFMIVGFLTLWAKLKYGVKEAQASAKIAAESATKAADKAEVVEKKLDANTVTTNEVSTKTDTIVRQTNGTMDQVHMLIAQVASRVDKLEEYNRDSAHRLLDAINAVHMKVVAIATVQKIPIPTAMEIPIKAQ